MTGQVMVSGRWVPIEAVAELLAREYKRDPDGQFASGGGSEGGSDEGEHGYGRDPDGVSYTEDDIDQDTGEPKFSPAYREQYGPVLSDAGMGPGNQYAVTITEKGGFHIADDTGGTRNREVLQEFKGKPSTFEAVTSDIDDAARSPGSFAAQRKETTAAGIRVEPAGGGVSVTWSSGKTTMFDPDTAADLGDAGTWAPDAYRKSRR